MKVSIITVVYNGEKYIGDCLRSVNQQDYPDIEHIVMDGASVDGTPELVRANLMASGTFVSEPDKGMYDAINKGLRLATGSIIGLLHADDMLAGPHVISKIVAGIQAQQAEAVYGDLNYVHPEKLHVIRHWKSRQYQLSDLASGWMPPHPTLYIRRAVLDRIGEYSLEYGSAADYEMILRLLYTQRIRAVYLPFLFVNMRTGGLSNRNWYSRLEGFRADYKAAKAHGIHWPLLAVITKKLRKLNQFI